MVYPLPTESPLRFSLSVARAAWGLTAACYHKPNRGYRFRPSGIVPTVRHALDCQRHPPWPLGVHVGQFQQSFEGSHRRPPYLPLVRQQRWRNCASCSLSDHTSAPQNLTCTAVVVDLFLSTICTFPRKNVTKSRVKQTRGGLFRPRMTTTLTLCVTKNVAL